MRENSELAPKQLSMSVGARAIQRLTPVVLPAGYRLRTYQPGDESGWVALLEAAGFTGWNEGKFNTYIQEPERREGSHLVTREGQPVAAAFASQRADQPPIGGLDYVVSHPDHRNRKLGHAVCGAVLTYLAGRGYPSVRLLTDDWRLPAIKVYLNLGFRPLINRMDMPVRWEAIYRQLFGKGPFAA